MTSKIASGLLCPILAAMIGVGGLRAETQPAPKEAAEKSDPAAPKSPGDPPERGGAPPGRPAGPQRIFGEVTDVRGNVLQMRTEESEGLTRVILASDAQIIRDDKLTLEALQPGAKVNGEGRPVEGTGTAAVPLKLQVQTLTVEGGGPGGPFMFGFGDRGGPLMRGRRGELFRHQNYSGTTTFSAQVKSVNPLVLVDDQGNAVPVVVGQDVEVHQRRPRPIKEGDVTAGAQLMAMGETTPDGLLNAHMVFLFDEGGNRGSVPGTITEVNDKGVKVRPRFGPREMQVGIDPAAKLYLQENLNLDAIHVGDMLSFTGKVIGGDAKTPTTLVLRTIAPAEGETPKVEEGGGPFGGHSVTATVKGRIVALQPLRVQTEDGREVTIKVPGQVVYARYQPLGRDTLKAGQRAIFSGQYKQGGPVADLIIVNPSLAMGPGF